MPMLDRVDQLLEGQRDQSRTLGAMNLVMRDRLDLRNRRGLHEVQIPEQADPRDARMMCRQRQTQFVPSRVLR